MIVPRFIRNKVINTEFPLWENSGLSPEKSRMIRCFLGTGDTRYLPEIETRAKQLIQWYTRCKIKLPPHQRLEIEEYWNAT